MPFAEHLLARASIHPLLHDPRKTRATMLELQEISLSIGQHPDHQALLEGVSAHIPEGHFAAILGPSGCGKSTLLKVIAGILEPTSGSVHWEGRDLALEKDLEPHEIGYVPQFSIAHELLTARENVVAALQLRIAGLDDEHLFKRADAILEEVGVSEIADRQVRVLSGGQKRRLALALEMVCSPALLLCDEVTSGLDPKAEDEIVRLMRKLSREDKRVVLSVTHSLRHVDLYDSILVLYQGVIAYHGPSELLYHYFSVENPEDLFPRLARRSAGDWYRSWLKHRAAYFAAEHDADQQVAAAEDQPAQTIPYEEIRARFEKGEPGFKRSAERRSDAATPSASQQFSVLLARRWRIFFRDRGQLVLHLALILGFPFLVVIFALEGLPQIQHLNLEPQQNVLQQMAEKTSYLMQATHVGSLVSGLVMFQVILLTLMGSNNAAREIAAERPIFEKEKFGGVRASSYVASKACFLAVLVAAQSVWMGVFVNIICHFPGDLFSQIAVLFAVNAAMTSICLGISSLMKSAEQASLVSVYLVGFQLPLSGAVLAMPKMIAWLTRPFIAAYWAWSGFLQTMRETAFYDVIQIVTQTHLSALALCLWVLGCHIVLGLFIAYVGCKSSRWE